VDGHNSAVEFENYELTDYYCLYIYSLQRTVKIKLLNEWEFYVKCHIVFWPSVLDEVADDYIQLHLFVPKTILTIKNIEMHFLCKVPQMYRILSENKSNIQ
jgi:hypothetical protein